MGNLSISYLQVRGQRIKVQSSTDTLYNTLPIAKILSVKNARAWVSMQNWAGLAVLFSRQLLNGSQDFNILIFIYFLKYKTIKTHARALLPLNISAVGSVD